MKMPRIGKALYLCLVLSSLVVVPIKSVHANGRWTFLPEDSELVVGTFGNTEYTLSPDGSVQPNLPTGVRMNRDGSFNCGRNAPMVLAGCTTENTVGEEITAGGVAVTHNGNSGLPAIDAGAGHNEQPLTFNGTEYTRKADGSFEPPLPEGIRYNAGAGRFECGANAPQVFAGNQCEYVSDIVNPVEGRCVGDNTPHYCSKCQEENPPSECTLLTKTDDDGDSGDDGNTGGPGGNGNAGGPGDNGTVASTTIPATPPEMSIPSVLVPGSGFDGDLRKQGIMSGTGPYKACQKLMTSSVNWSDSVGKAQDQSDTSIFTKSWNVLFKEHQEAAIAKVRSYAGQEITPNIKANLAKVFQDAVNAAHQRYAVLNGCIGLLMVTDDSDNYSDEELKRVTDGKMTKKSMDGKITCQAAGPETQDWGPCKTLVNTYNAAAVGQVVAQEAQKLDYMDKELETQTDLMADGGKDPTKALKSQESMVRKQAQIANQRAAFHGAKLAALLAAKEAMPTKDGEYGSCQASTGIQTSVGLLRAQYNHFVGAFKDFAGRVVGAGNVNFGYEVAAVTSSESSEKVSVKLNNSLKEASDEIGEGLPGSQVAGQIGSDSTWAKEIEGGDSKFSHPVAVCDSAIYDKTNVIMNSEAIEQANQALVQAGVDMAANIAKGQILDNQADRIADAADGIKNFDPGEMPMFQEEDAQVTACQADPMSEACLELENTRGVGYAGSSFNFGGANRATTPGSVADDGDSSGDSASSSDGTDRSGIASKMGRSIAAVNKGGGLESKVGRAGVKKKGNPDGAGGGGGGSGGAAPPSGGGVKGGGGAGGARSAYKGKKVRYRGGAGGLSFSGGNSKRRAKKKSANPFASLLGKKGKKKGGTLNFRNPASIGKKGGSLFQMISKRYSVVTSKKQLLEYEDKK